MTQVSRLGIEPTLCWTEASELEFRVLIHLATTPYNCPIIMIFSPFGGFWQNWIYCPPLNMALLLCWSLLEIFKLILYRDFPSHHYKTEIFPLTFFCKKKVGVMFPLGCFAGYRYIIQIQILNSAAKLYWVTQCKVNPHNKDVAIWSLTDDIDCYGLCQAQAE